MDITTRDIASVITESVFHFDTPDQKADLEDDLVIALNEFFSDLPSNVSLSTEDHDGIKPEL